MEAAREREEKGRRRRGAFGTESASIVRAPRQYGLVQSREGLGREIASHAVRLCAPRWIEVIDVLYAAYGFSLGARLG